MHCFWHVSPKMYLLKFPTRAIRTSFVIIFSFLFPVPEMAPNKGEMGVFCYSYNRPLSTTSKFMSTR